MILVTTYLFMAVVASVCAILVLATSSKAFMKVAAISPTSQSKMYRLIYILFALSPIAYFATPAERLTIVSAQSIDKSVNELPSLQQNQTNNKTNSPVGNGELPSSSILLCLIALSAFLISRKYYFDQKKIKEILSESFLFKSMGKVRILLSDTVSIPFAYRDLKHFYVVIPNELLGDSQRFSLVVKHEIQHHRQGDTTWSHLSFFFQALFFWNPIIHFMVNRISEIQELACDEALIGRKGVNAREYCDCLVSVAESALNPSKMLVGTTGMTQGNSAHKLKWRIEMMRRYKFNSGRWFSLLVGAISLGVVTSVAIASSGMIRDKQITLVEANNLVLSSVGDEFPVEVNEEILAQLNYYIGTSRGRDFIRESLGRRQQYEEVFQKKLSRYSVPDELLAVALIESGYRNLPQGEHPSYSIAAGVWQFIPGTARNYGLQVDEVTDERLDVELETDAAMRLLRTLNSRFDDWRLALIGYNAGGNKVQRGINATGSRDPWELIEAGYGGDANYLAKVMAGVLILKNPSLID